MSFLILVVKDPMACAGCRIENITENSYGDVLSHDCPFVYKGFTDEFRERERHPKCPQRKMPDFRIVDPLLDKDRKKYISSYVNGWNDCIAHILETMGETGCSDDAGNAGGSLPIQSAGSGDSDRNAGQK